MQLHRALTDEPYPTVHHAHSGGGPGSGGKRHTLPTGAGGIARHGTMRTFPARSGFISRPDPDHAAAVGEGAAYGPWFNVLMPFGAHWNLRPKHVCCIPAVDWLGGRHERPAHGSADFLQTTCDVASQHRIQHERLDAHQMQSRFPAFCFEGDEEGYYEPEAGYVMPERCIEVQLGEAKRLGAAITTGCRMTGWHSIKGGYRVETAKGAFDCETLILCTGPWVADALPHSRTMQRLTGRSFIGSNRGPGGSNPARCRSSFAFLIEARVILDSRSEGSVVA